MPAYTVQQIKDLYKDKKDEISARLGEFEQIWQKGTRENLFTELVFCILTPMANARFCWGAVENMVGTGMLWSGDAMRIALEIKGARFINRKSNYIVEAREMFMGEGRIPLRSIIKRAGDGQRAREWLVANVKGLGYKEGSHFLRNIGFDTSLAILDRHILKNMAALGLIGEMPESLSKNRYMEMERALKVFSRDVEIPISQLDLLLWYKETGQIFK